MTGAVDWYVDADGDGHGVPGDVVQSCPPVAGRAILDDDCDDEDGGRTPGRFEECNLVDDDCDGATDEAPFCDAVTRIGPEGGSLEITNGEGRPVIVTVPAGAVEMPTVFSLGEMPTGGLAPLESDQQFLDVPYRVQAAATPTAPLTWQLPFDADGGTDDVIVLRFDVEDSAWVWAPGAEVEIEGPVATITLEVAELGIYAVVRDASPPFCRADAECLQETSIAAERGRESVHSRLVEPAGVVGRSHPRRGRQAWRSRERALAEPERSTRRHRPE